MSGWYIQDGYIYGPGSLSGRFYVAEGYIYGLNEELPWLQP